jgi:hypothetical protein
MEVFVLNYNNNVWSPGLVCDSIETAIEVAAEYGCDPEKWEPIGPSYWRNQHSASTYYFINAAVVKTAGNRGR